MSLATKRGAQERGSWPGHHPYQADSPSSSQAKLERDLNIGRHEVNAGLSVAGGVHAV